jgi:hypothetical protein
VPSTVSGTQDALVSKTKVSWYSPFQHWETDNKQHAKYEKVYNSMLEGDKSMGQRKIENLVIMDHEWERGKGREAGVCSIKEDIQGKPYDQQSPSINLNLCFHIQEMKLIIIQNTYENSYD